MHNQTLSGGKPYRYGLATQDKAISSVSELQTYLSRVLGVQTRRRPGMRLVQIATLYQPGTQLVDLFYVPTFISGLLYHHGHNMLIKLIF